jgi:hypothetical protein
MATFPLLADGAKTQFPLTEALRFQTLSAVVPSGERYSYAERANGIRYWTIGGPSISDADLATWRAFFEARRGSWEAFDFVDPRTGTTYTNCRFDQDTFEFEAIGPDENRVEIRIKHVPN